MEESIGGVLLKKIIFILNHTWGIVTTLLSYAVLLVCKLLNYSIYKIDGIFVVVSTKPNWGAFSFGNVCVLSSNSSISVQHHEMGHCIQNAFFGIFAIFLVYIPSIVRAAWRTKNGIHGGYYDVWFERTATEWGEAIYG